MDRNNLLNFLQGLVCRSLSARRAWIEIVAACPFSCCGTVALRKESVDRNKYVVQCRKTLGVSLSARRAWIEIGLFGADTLSH